MKIIKFVTLLTLAIVVFSCDTSNKTKSDNLVDKQLTQIKVLYDTIDNLKSGIENLQEEISSLKSELDILNVKSNFHSEENYEKIASKVNDKDLHLIKVLNWKFHLSEENHIVRSTINNWHKLKDDDKVNYKTKEFLNSFFTDSNLNLITYFLSKNNLYESSKTNLLVNSLIESYTETDSDFLDEMYNFAEEGLYINRNEIKTLLSNVKKFDETDFGEYQNNQPSYGANVSLYSFWARRHHENNKEIVYRVLKEIQTRMDTIYGEAMYE